MRNASGPPAGNFGRPGGYGGGYGLEYPGGGYDEFYDDGYYYEEEEQDQTLSRIVEAFKKLRAKRKDKKKKKGDSSSSSDDSDDDGKRRNRRQQQTLQPVQYMNAIQPALITHYPAYGQPIQTLAYVTRPVAVATNPAPVTNVSVTANPPVFAAPTVSDQQQLVPGPLPTDSLLGPTASTYNPPDPMQYSQLGQDIIGGKLSPLEDISPRLPIETPNSFLLGNKRNQVKLPPPRPTSMHLDSPVHGLSRTAGALENLEQQGAALSTSSVESLDRRHKPIGIRNVTALSPGAGTPQNLEQPGRAALFTSSVESPDRRHKPIGIQNGTGLRPLSTTKLENFDRPSHPRIVTGVTPTLPVSSIRIPDPSNEQCFRVSPSTFSKYQEIGKLSSNAAVTMRAWPDIRDVGGITDVYRLDLTSATQRPITVWPDRPPAEDIKLQIDSKIYTKNSVIELTQELQCMRSNLNHTPVSRMIALLLKEHDAIPEEYQLINEDNVIMKWSAMMGEYQVRDGARLRLRPRKKPGRVVSKPHRHRRASTGTSKGWTESISETPSSRSNRATRSVGKVGDVMY